MAFHDNFCWSTKSAENLVSMIWYCVDTKSFTLLVHLRKAQSSKSDELPLMSFIWDLSNLLWNAMKNSSDSWGNLGSHGKAQQQQKLRQTESIHTGNAGNTRYTYQSRRKFASEMLPRCFWGSYDFQDFSKGERLNLSFNEFHWISDSQRHANLVEGQNWVVHLSFGLFQWQKMQSVANGSPLFFQQWRVKV